jgi:hypothetical protein
MFLTRDGALARGPRKWFPGSQALLIPTLASILLVLCWSPLLVFSDDKLKSEFVKQQQNLSRQSSPVGKVKVLIKISDLHLALAKSAIKRNDFTGADRSLNEYRKIVDQAVETLKASGRNARKNPSGFKEFEISLRKQLRTLDDLKSHYSFDQVQDIDETIQVARSAQEAMISEIFGAENTGFKKDKTREAKREKESR